MDIGSLGGKWIQFLLSADRIICVDINDLGFEYIRRKLPTEKITFYLTEGNELTGIPTGTVDVVFSMDTLVRTSKQTIREYIFESARVLREGGSIFLHLPCEEQPDSRSRAFAPLRLREIERFCRDAQFTQIRIDKQVIKHGVICEAVRGSSTSGIARATQ